MGNKNNKSKYLHDTELNVFTKYDETFHKYIDLSKYNDNEYLIKHNKEKDYLFFLDNQIKNLKKDINISIENNINNLHIYQKHIEFFKNIIFIVSSTATGKTTYLLNNNDESVIDIDWLYLTEMKNNKFFIDLNLINKNNKNYLLYNYKKLFFSIADNIIKNYIFDNNFNKIFMGALSNDLINYYHKFGAKIIFLLFDDIQHYKRAKMRGITKKEFKNIRKNYYDTLYSLNKLNTNVFYVKYSDNNFSDAINIAKTFLFNVSINKYNEYLKFHNDIINLVDNALKYHKGYKKDKNMLKYSIEYTYYNIGYFYFVSIINNKPNIKLIINNNILLIDNCRYISKNNDFHIYQLNWYRNEVLLFFNQLCDNRRIPDIQFVLNIGDYPLIRKDNMHPYRISRQNIKIYKPNISIFSYSKTSNYKDILLPTPDIINFIFKKKPYDIDNINFYTDFDNKINKIIFRGSNTSYTKNNPRIKSHLISLKYDYIDSRIVGFSDYPLILNENNQINYIDISNIHDISNPNNFICMKEQSKYKYILNIDGFVSAWRFPILLSSHSVIFKVESYYKEYYYDLLIPFKHFIPIKNDLSDIHEKYLWCENNQDKCKEIINNANNFVKNILNIDNVFNYCQKLFFEYYC